MGAAGDTPVKRAGGSRRWDLPDLVVAAVLLAGAGGAVWVLGRHWFFFYDEWGMILYRRSGGAAAFLAPHNGHLQAVMVLLYRALFSVAGLDHGYGPYRLVAVLLHLACAGLLYTYARPRVGRPVAAGAAAGLALLGSGWEVLFWLDTSGITICLIAFVAVLLVWDHRPAGEVPVTVVLGLLALASFGLSVALAAGLLVESLWSRRLRRAAAVAVPLGAWVVWWALYRPGAATPGALRHLPGGLPTGDLGVTEVHFAGLAHLAGWLRSSVAGVAGALGGVHTPAVEVVVVVVVVVLVGHGLVRARRERVAGLVGALGAFWILTYLGRSSTSAPAASRYQYVGAFLVLLAVVESLPAALDRLAAVPSPGLRRPAVGRALSAVVVVAWLGAVAANVRTATLVGNAAAGAFAPERAGLGVIEACGPRLPPTYNPDPVLLPGFAAGPFLAAARALGNPVPPAPRCPR